MWSHLINMRKHFSCYFLQFHILLSCHQIQHSYYPLPLLFPPAIIPPLHLDWPHAPKKVDPSNYTGPMPPKWLISNCSPLLFTLAPCPQTGSKLKGLMDLALILWILILWPRYPSSNLKQVLYGHIPKFNISWVKASYLAW